MESEGLRFVALSLQSQNSETGQALARYLVENWFVVLPIVLKALHKPLTRRGELGLGLLRPRKAEVR